MDVGVDDSPSEIVSEDEHGVLSVVDADVGNGPSIFASEDTIGVVSVVDAEGKR